MGLNLYTILQEVLTESIDGDSVVDAIYNQQQVIINYSDEENRAPAKRIIEPYVYGLTKAGNPCIRAYQYEGDTFRGKPKWKMFRLDRIESWQPTDRHFNTTPAANGWPAQAYNEEGDKCMNKIIYQVHFGGNEEPDSLEVARAKTRRLQNSTPINISQMGETNPQGAVTNDKVQDKDNYYTNQNQQPVIRGAINLDDVDTATKHKDYWKDYRQASKEKTAQNKKFKKQQYDNTRNSLRNADKFKPNWHTNDEDEEEDNEI